MLEVGTTLQDRYQIQDLLGQGGMGEVYLAHALHLSRPVAIKSIHFHDHDPEEQVLALRQFAKEAALLKALDHPNLVRYLDDFQQGSSHFLVMEYVEGETLEDHMHRLRETHHFLPVPLVVGWMDQVCQALAYMHSQEPPIIFRDLKPANIMLEPDETIRLFDMGIARRLDSSTTTSFIKGTGTDGYAPLEQYGIIGSTDTRSDVYALGATMYCLLTWHPPSSAVDIAMDGEEIIPARKTNPAVPIALNAAIHKMLAMRREARFQTVREAHQAILAAI